MEEKHKLQDEIECKTTCLMYKMHYFKNVYLNYGGVLSAECKLLINIRLCG